MNIFSNLPCKCDVESAKSLTNLYSVAISQPAEHPPCTQRVTRRDFTFKLNRIKSCRHNFPFIQESNGTHSVLKR